MIGASTGLFGAVWAQAEARKVLGAIGARVVDRELPVGAGARRRSARTGCRAEREAVQALSATLDELLEAASGDALAA